MHTVMCVVLGGVCYREARFTCFIFFSYAQKAYRFFFRLFSFFLLNLEILSQICFRLSLFVFLLLHFLFFVCLLRVSKLLPTTPLSKTFVCESKKCDFLYELCFAFVFARFDFVSNLLFAHQSISPRSQRLFVTFFLCTICFGSEFSMYLRRT